MKKEKIAILFICLLLGSVILTVLSISFVHAQDAGSTTNNSISLSTKKLGDAFNLFFDSSGWSTGAVPPNVAKIFFFIMVWILAYVLMSFFFKEHPALGGIFSFAVSFLAIAYITPEEVFSLLNSYTALGLAITALIPLLLLGGFTYRAISAPPRGRVTLIMLQWLAWGMFGIFSIYRLGYDTFRGHEGSAVVNVMLLVATGAAVWMFAGNKMMIRWLSKQVESSRMESANQTVTEAAAGARELAKLHRVMSGERLTGDRVG